MAQNSSEDLISSLTGTALRVFVYAVKKVKEIGVRETQRDLGLKTASHAQYHLQRLEQFGLLKQTKSNKYYLEEEYENLRSLKLGILTEIYVFKGWLIPSLGIFSGFLGTSLILIILFYFFISPLSALILGSTSLFLAASYAGYRAIQIVKSFKQNEESE